MKALTHKLRLLALRGLMTHPPIDGPMGPALAQIQRQLPELLKTDPKAVLAAMRRPEVLVPLLVLRSGLREAPELFSQVLPHLVAGLRWSPPLLWDHPVEQLFTAESHYRFVPPLRALVSDLSGVEVEEASGQRVDLQRCDARRRGWPLQCGVELAAEDSNPLRMDEAHPEKVGNALSLGERSSGEWQSQLNAALDLIGQTLPSFYRALPNALHRIVPIGFAPERHLSASYREAPGTIYMTLHPSPLTLAEAIVHEVQHGKLNTLSWFDAVLSNAMSEWTASPVRSDLRPIWGVLLAVHAFVPVACMHQKMEEQSHPLIETPLFKRRRSEVLEGNDNGLKTVIEKGEPTAMGQRVITDLKKLHDHCMQHATELELGNNPSAMPPG